MIRYTRVTITWYEGFLGNSRYVRRGWLSSMSAVEVFVHNLMTLTTRRGFFIESIRPRRLRVSVNRKLIARQATYNGIA